MPEQTYKIKPLEWRGTTETTPSDKLQQVWRAQYDMLPGYVIRQHDERIVKYSVNGGTLLSVRHDTLSEAQAAAESDYRRRMEAGLVRVVPEDEAIADWWETPEGGSDAR